MNYIKLFLFILALHNISFGQEVPQVKFNHLYFIIDSNDLEAVRHSDFINKELTALEVRTTKAEGNARWTGTYMYGTENYIELFDTTSFGVNVPLGLSGIAFSVDKIGQLET